jgi:LAGLIDADG endonuclease
MLVGISEAIRVLFFMPIFTLALKFIIIILNFLYYIYIFFILANQNPILKIKGKSNKTNFNYFKDKPVNSNFCANYSATAPMAENQKFNQWLAGLIDGDGCFQLSKKGYASLEIVAHIRDKNTLYQIKQKFGGSIKLRAGLNHLRYRMHHKQGMLNLIKAVNGEIRNPIRLLQLNKICEKYNISIIQPCNLTFENGWLSGFFDSDGSIYLNLLSSQMLFTASQKNKYLLDLLCELYGGSVYIEKTSFKWIVSKKSEILNLLEYFKICPCKSAKLNRINAVPKY